MALGDSSLRVPDTNASEEPSFYTFVRGSFTTSTSTCVLALVGKRTSSIDSDHRAVSLDLNLTSIKYKVKSSLNRGDIDWRKICEEDEQRKLYNKYLLQLTSRDMTYKEYCEAIVRAGETTITVVTCTCEGWYRASKDILAPAIQEKNCLRHRLHDSSTLSPEEIADIKTQHNL